MLVQIRDRAALSSLSSTSLRHYLKNHGWKDAGRWGKRATIHTKKYGGRNWEILIPISDAVADYAESMAESIAILSTVEERSQLDVFYDILKAGPGEAPELVKAINEQKKRAKEVMQKASQNLAAFPLDRAIADAYSLQRGGNIEEAIEKWRSIANVSEGIDNELAARAWFSIGSLLQQRDMENAEDHIQEVLFAYDRAIHLNPDEAKVYYNRGIVKLVLGDYEAAIADFDQAIHLKPDFTAAYINRGTVKRVLGQYEAAIADHDRAIRLKPDFAPAYNNRGIAKIALSQHDAAITDFNRAIDLNPDDEVYYNRGIAKSALSQHDAAITDFNRAIDLNPDYAEAYHSLGAVRSDLGLHKAALADYDQAIRLKPDDAAAYNNRGIVKGELGQHKAAIEDYDQAIHFNPDLVLAYNNRGIEKSMLSRHEAAIADFNRAIERDPDDALAYYNRGNANAILDRKAEARADFETTLDLANRSGNTDLKSRIERQLQVIKDTVSTSDSVRETKDLPRSQLGYDSVRGEALFDFNSPVVTRSPIQRALV